MSGGGEVEEFASCVPPPLEIGDAVEVFSFGIFQGVIAGFPSDVTIQGRIMARTSSVREHLQDGRRWHSTITDVVQVRRGCRRSDCRTFDKISTRI
ncbi:hypothetical protein IP70_16890 [alpha proteobacterium AAP38]|nr:hypothetical protein IP70_16890 [alpha proteobacterium AAP38]